MATFSKTRAAEKFGTPLGIRSSMVHNYYAKIIISKINWIIANKIFSVMLSPKQSLHQRHCMNYSRNKSADFIKTVALGVATPSVL